MLIIEKKKNISIITSMRGLASLMVFLFHLFCVTNNYFNSSLLIDVFYYGKYGVEIFFVISGYVITHSMIAGKYKLKHFGNFFLKRVIRIEPPYLAAIFLIIAGIWIKQLFHVGALVPLPSLQQVLFHLGYLIPFSKYDWLSIVFWTLAIEFQFYFLFSLVLPLFTKSKVARGMITSLLLLLSFFVKSEAVFFHHAPIFLLGIYLALFKLEIIRREEFTISVTIFLFSIFLGINFEVFIFSFFAFILILREPAFRSRTFKFLGDISYSLYLCHTIVAFTIINIAFRFPQTIPIRIGVFFLSFFCTIIFSYVFYRLIELPSKVKASSIKYK